MFNKKDKKIWEIFNVLLLKIPKYPTNLTDQDIYNLYKRSIQIYDSYEKLNYIYKSTGDIDENIIKGMVFE